MTNGNEKKHWNQKFIPDIVEKMRIKNRIRFKTDDRK